MRRKIVFLAAAFGAVGVGVGLYFLLRGGSAPQIPPSQRSAILERAQAEGVIEGYKVASFLPSAGHYRYVVKGSPIELRLETCGDSAGPCDGATLIIDYRHTAAKQADAILEIAQKQNRMQRIIFGPAYYP